MTKKRESEAICLLSREGRRRRLRALLVKEMLQIIKDPSSILISVVLPVLLLFLYGTGVSLDLDHLKVRAPLVWTDSTDEKTIEQDLARGVILFPGTAVPGHIGNAFVTGHSSDYLWQRGPYRDIFKNLPQLKEGDEVIFSFSYANGKQDRKSTRLNSSHSQISYAVF